MIFEDVISTSPWQCVVANWAPKIAIPKNKSSYYRNDEAAEEKNNPCPFASMKMPQH
jgi:hypothetical protein